MNPLLRDELTEILREFAKKNPSQAAPAPAPLPASSTYPWFDWNDSCLAAPQEQTPRARKERAVLRIATYYPWGRMELQRLLDRNHADSVETLSGAALDRVHDHMLALDDRAKHDCDLPEFPPAT